MKDQHEPAAKAWSEFRSAYLSHSEYGIVSPTLMQDGDELHPLAGVVGRIGSNECGQLAVNFPDELVAISLARVKLTEGQSLVPYRAWIPLPRSAVEKNPFSPRSWRLTPLGIELLKALEIKTLPASIGIFDLKRNTL